MKIKPVYKQIMMTATRDTRTHEMKIQDLFGWGYVAHIDKALEAKRDTLCKLLFHGFCCSVRYRHLSILIRNSLLEYINT